MSVINRLSNTTTLVKGVLGLLALCPGVVLFIGLVEIPPSMGRLIYLTSFFFSVLSILIIITLGDWIQRIGNGVAVALAALSVTAGLACLLTYMSYSHDHVVDELDRNGKAVGKVLIPSSPSPAILEAVKHHHPTRPTREEYQDAMVNASDPETLKEQLMDETWGVMLTMLLLLIGAEVLLITPIVALAWRLAGTVETAPAQDAPTAS